VQADAKEPVDAQEALQQVDCYYVAAGKVDLR